MEGGILYKCVIVTVLEETLKIHYVGFNKRHDEWIPVDSNRLVGSGDVDESELAVANATQPDYVDGSSCSGGGGDRSGVDDGSGVGDRSGFDDRSGVDGLLAGAALVGRISVKRRTRDEAEGANLSKRPSMQLDVPLMTAEATSASVDDLSSGVGESVPTCPDANNMKCRFCNMLVVGGFINCVVCKSSFHADSMCVGVGADAIKVLLADRGGAVTYRCCQCRLGDPGDSGGYNQLVHIVGDLVRELKSLKLRDSRAPISTVDVSGQGNQSVSRETVLNHVRELREREKRADFIILRGLGNVSLEVVRQRFLRICEILGIAPVDLVDLTRSPRGLGKKKNRPTASQRGVRGD